MMQLLDVDTLPAFNKVVEDAQRILQAMTPYKVKVHVTLGKQEMSDETKVRFLVTSAYGVTWEDLISRGRGKRNVSEALHMYCYLMTTYFKLGSSALARRLNKDHTTIIHAVRKVNAMIDCQDEELVPILKNIIKIVCLDTKAIQNKDQAPVCR
jgi:chromosomal replication initiation ATPase DnaA